MNPLLPKLIFLQQQYCADNKSLVVVDSRKHLVVRSKNTGAVLINVIRRFFDQEDLDLLKREYLVMYEKSKPRLTNSKRGKDYFSYDIGILRRSPSASKGNKCYVTETFKKPPVQTFVRNTKSIYEKIDAYFKEVAPDLHRLYHDASANYPEDLPDDLKEPFCAWALMFINHEHRCFFHKDGKDFPGGFCLVFPFGDYWW